MSEAEGRRQSPLNQRCSVCGAMAGQSCPTEAEPLCGELRVDDAPCIRTAGHGPGHRAACVPERESR